MLFLMPLAWPTGPSKALACRGCGTVVAFEEDLLSVMDRPVRAVYINPLGLAGEIVTLGGALNLAWAPEATTEHTWFEGYAWRPAACASCGLHLGWRYEAARPDLDPPVFFGLLTSAVGPRRGP